jgi:uncharacterized protein YggE
MRLKLGLASVLATAAALAPAAAQAQAPAKSVTAIGTGTAKVTPNDRKSNASIKAAIDRADAAARPKAMAAARERGVELAQSAGLTLGAIVAVAETPPSPFGPFNTYGLQGTFGPGKYCGVVRAFHIRRDSRGVIHRVAGRRHRACRFPSQDSVSLSVTFAAT